MDMFIVLIVVRVSQMTRQIYQIMHFKYVKLLYANYNTIKLFVKSVHPSKTWPFKSTFPPPKTLLLLQRISCDGNSNLSVA